MAAFLDWQTRKDPAACNKYLLDNELNTDVEFLIGAEQKCMKAHKLILASRSPVFELMFYGSLKERDSPIQIPDVEPAGFRTFLRYCYYEFLNINLEDASSSIYAAKKYMLPVLEEKCRKILISSLGTKNIWTTYTRCITDHDDELHDACKVYFTKRAKVVSKALKSPDFLEIPRWVLSDFLQRETKRMGHKTRTDQILIAEIELFTACNACADAECGRQEIDNSGENKREVLGDCLFKLDFFAMTPDDITNLISPTNISTAEEKCSILEYGHTLPRSPHPEKFLYACNKLYFPVEYVLNTKGIQEYSLIYQNQLDMSCIEIEIQRRLILSQILVLGYKDKGLAEIFHDISVVDAKTAIYQSMKPTECSFQDVLSLHLEPAVRLEANCRYKIKVGYDSGEGSTLRTPLEYSPPQADMHQGYINLKLIDISSNRHIVGLRVQLV